MTKVEVQNVSLGLYRIYWKSGGLSLAAVGMDRAGRRWYAPTNWIGIPSLDWRPVERLEKICPKDTLSMEELSDRYDGDAK